MMIVATAQLYGPLHERLMALLNGLAEADWGRTTVCRDWTVQDIAAHILDTQIRILSMGRDGHRPPPPEREIDSYGALVEFLNGLNADWVRAARRMSPRVLTGLLGVTGPELARHVESLDPAGTALFPVAWAGETVSANWFDIGRNYTEYWHHQQQIRDAVGAEPLTSRGWLHPVIALFLHALPPAYAGTAADGDIAITVTGEAGGEWTLTQSTAGAWKLEQGAAEGRIAAHLEISDDAAWRFLTKGLTAEQTRQHLRCVQGDALLAEPFLRARAIMG